MSQRIIIVPNPGNAEAREVKAFLQREFQQSGQSGNPLINADIKIETTCDTCGETHTC